MLIKTIKVKTSKHKHKSKVINLDVEQQLSLKFVLPLLKEYANKTKEKVIFCKKCKIPFVTNTNYKKDICLECNKPVHKKNIQNKNF